MILVDATDRGRGSIPVYQGQAQTADYDAVIWVTSDLPAGVTRLPLLVAGLAAPVTGFGPKNPSTCSGLGDISLDRRLWCGPVQHVSKC